MTCSRTTLIIAMDKQLDRQHVYMVAAETGIQVGGGIHLYVLKRYWKNRRLYILWPEKVVLV